MSAAVVAGRYRLEGMLARGRSSEVWRATDLTIERPVALRLVQAAPDATARERFRADALGATALRHPGVAPVLDVGESADGVSAWVVQELVEGEPLSALLDRGPLGADRALGVLDQVGDALQAVLDAGVAHREVTPANLVVSPGGAVRLTGVGIAGSTSEEDVHALGLVVRACLTGGRGVDAPLPADVPAPVRDLVTRCLGDSPPGPRELARHARQLRKDGVAARGRSRRALLLAVPLLLVVLAALGARALLTGGPRTTQVPVVREGSSAVEAQRQLLDAGFVVHWSTEVAPDVPEGRVVRTEPAGSTRLVASGAVTVVVSGEVLVGLPYAAAQAVLERRGLRPRRLDDARGGPPGTVRSLEPDGPLPPGAEVGVHVVPGGPATSPSPSTPSASSPPTSTPSTSTPSTAGSPS